MAINILGDGPTRPTQTFDVKTPPTANLEGLEGIDALIAAQTALIQEQIANSRQSILQARKGLKQERRLGRREARLTKRAIKANTIEPEAPLPSLSMAEVQRARTQQYQDAASRGGIRKTILAGETGGYQGATSSATGRQSILG